MTSEHIQSVMEAVNAMVKEGIIGRDAIGGALAATPHSEPIATADLDIFFYSSAFPERWKKWREAHL